MLVEYFLSKTYCFFNARKYCCSNKSCQRIWIKWYNTKLTVAKFHPQVKEAHNRLFLSHKNVDELFDIKTLRAKREHDENIN